MAQGSSPVEEQHPSPEAERRRFFIITSSIIGVTLALIAAFFAFPQDKASLTPGTEVFELTAEEQAQAQETVEAFLTVAGTWGVKGEDVRATTVEEIKQELTVKGEASPHYRGRLPIYNYVKEKYLAPGSPLDYSSSLLSAWRDPLALRTMATYTVTAANATVPEQGERTTGEKATKYVTVAATFTTKGDYRTRTSDDGFWDGTYDFFDNSYSSTATVRLQQDDKGTWKVYDLPAVTQSYLLVLCKDPQNSTALIGMKREHSRRVQSNFRNSNGSPSSPSPSR